MAEGQGTTIGKAYIQIVPSAKGIKKQLEGVLDKEVPGNKIGEKAGTGIASGIKGALIKAGIGIAVGKAISAGIKESAHLQQAIGGIETLFGTGGNTIEQFAQKAGKSVGAVRSEYERLKASETLALNNANNAWKTAGMSAGDYMDTLTSFAAALKSSGLSEAEAAKAGDAAVIAMSDNANKMGTDLESIKMAYQGFAKQNYTMLDNLKLGYGGTRGEMERLLADAEKLSGQHYDISNLSDVYSAIQVIQTNLGITGTTAKEAATTLEGSFNSMKAAALNAIGSLALGENVESSMKGLAESTSTFLFSNFLPALGTFFKSLPTAIATFIQTGLPQIMEQSGKLGDSILTGLGKFNEKLPALLDKYLPKIIEFLQNVGVKLIEFAGPLFDAVLQILSTIALKIYEHLPEILKTVGVLFAALVKAIVQRLPQLAALGYKMLFGLIKGIISCIPMLIKAVPKIVKYFFNLWKATPWGNLGLNLIRGIVKGISGSARLIYAIGRAVVTRIKSIFSNGFNAVKNKAGSAFDAIKNKISSKINAAKDVVHSAIEKIRNFFPLRLGKILSFSLPKISIGSIIKKIGGKSASAPDFNVRFQNFAKGAILSDPTIIGWRAGEAGREGIIPLEGRYMRPFANAIAGEMPGGGSVQNNYFNITVDGSDAPEEFADRLVKRLQVQLRTA